MYHLRPLKIPQYYTFTVLVILSLTLAFFSFMRSRCTLVTVLRLIIHQKRSSAGLCVDPLTELAAFLVDHRAGVKSIHTGLSLSFLIWAYILHGSILGRTVHRGRRISAFSYVKLPIFGVILDLLKTTKTKAYTVCLKM